MELSKAQKKDRERSHTANDIAMSNASIADKVILLVEDNAINQRCCFFGNHWGLRYDIAADGTGGVK
jgi:hypothetical protein